MSCPRCQEGVLLAGEPTGSIDADMLGAYFAPAPTGAEVKKHAVLLLTDGFGLPLKNSKLIADELAKRLECDVWVPDIFDGRPILPLNSMRLPERAGDKLPWWRMLLLILPNIGAFWHSTPATTDQRIEQFITALRVKKGYENLGAVGYCWGGGNCIRLGGRSDLLKTIVIAHPGGFNINHVRKFTIPSAWLCAEDDDSLPAKLREECEAELASRKGKDNFVEYNFTVYPGTAHGFACRPNFEYPEVKEGYEKALEQTIAWFQKTL